MRCAVWCEVCEVCGVRCVTCMLRYKALCEIVTFFRPPAASPSVFPWATSATGPSPRAGAAAAAADADSDAAAAADADYNAAAADSDANADADDVYIDHHLERRRFFQFSKT